MSSRPSRRAALAGGAGVLITACTKPPRRRVVPPVDPDVALRAAAVGREQALLAAYDRLLAGAAPAVLAHLGPLRADHVAHLEALGMPRTGAAAPTVPTAVPAAVPGPDLHVLERATSAAHAAAAVVASRRLAGVLASLAACEASHAVLL